MTIKSARVTAYAAPFDEPITNGLYTYTHTQIVVVELETTSGVVGIGWTHGGKIVYEALKEIAQVVVGQPLNVERIWKMIYRPKLFGRRGLATRAISAVDIAVWDAIGKECGRSVHQMLGGFRDSVPAYVAGGYYGKGKGLDGLQKEVAGKVSGGAKAIKMKIGAVPLAEDFARVNAVKEAVGEGVSVLVDANNAYTRLDALKMARFLEERDIFWFEEPLSPEDNAGAAELTKRTDLPIALGENEYTITGFRELIDVGAADVLNADAQILGGITEWQKCAHYADANHIPVAPHGDQEIHVHLVAAVPNGLIVEYYDNGLNRLKGAMFHQQLEVNADGSISAPTRPGLGFDLNHAALEKFKIEG
jgi:L-alanine-DL-glutamate epimerase-like enolase superfamily enzyme